MRKPILDSFSPRALSGLAAACLLFLAAPGALRAAEVIDRFQSDITVQPSGTMEVTETIAVEAEGNRIRHGIFRDFPLTFLDRDGATAHVDFNLVDVTRDGQEEPYHTEQIANGIRIYAGAAETEVTPGPHVYTFHYTTDRQIRFFADHDELYWNVTGNGWVFPILKAEARVTLPAAVPETGTEHGVTFYTGAFGSKGKAAEVTSREGNRVTIATTARLGAGEGLSVVIAQPKGAIAAPDGRQRTAWFLRDNLGAIIGWGGFVVVFLYYYSSWAKVGRDPPKGVMVPRWDPPGGLSPALINYVDNRGFSGEGWTALSASALQLAVNGYVTLEDLDKGLVLKRTAKAAPAGLPQGEDVLLAAVDGAGGTFAITAANGLTVQATGRRFRAAIEKEHRGKYYLHNWGYVAGGIALSLLALAAAFFLSHPSEDLIAMGVVMMIVCVVGGTMIANIGRGLMSGSTSLFRKVILVVMLSFVGFIALAMLSGLVIGALASATGVGGLPFLTSLGAIVLLNILFFFLMGAPTPLGRGLMDGVEGFRTYMTLAEKDRMNMAGAPTMSPGHYEKLLPYAVALGVEKPWSDSFERWLAAAVAAGAASAYQPVWYYGHGFDSGRISRFPGSMASTIASTIPAPQSNSSSGFSSGGGSSGGGGGGGGGGGW